MNGIESGMRALFPAIKNMEGAKQHLEHLKAEWEGQMQQD